LGALAALTAACTTPATLISVGPSGQGNGDSAVPAVNSDGSLVAFESTATNLVAGDTNGSSDIFVRNTNTGTTTRVSVTSTGAQANGDSHAPDISDDGRYVMFTSSATNLATTDTNGQTDVFVRDRTTNATILVSRASAGKTANGMSQGWEISPNGRDVLFTSSATNLSGAAGAGPAVYVADLVAGTIKKVATPGACPMGGTHTFVGPATMSADATKIAFAWGCDLPQYVFVSALTVGHAATQLDEGDFGDDSEADGFPSLTYSDNGSVLVWTATQQGHGAVGAELKLWTGSGSPTTLSTPLGSFGSTVSSTGRYVAYVSASGMTGPFFDGPFKLLVLDRTTNKTIDASLNTKGVDSNGDAVDPAISANAGVIAFDSTATDLVNSDTNNHKDVFTRSLANLFGSGASSAALVSRLGVSTG
jgi:hypothetical protein